jgi:hypothetical protein
MEIDRVRARQITTDERTELMKAGKCFTCRKQGHLSRDCPQRLSRPRTNARASTSQVKIEDDERRRRRAQDQGSRRQDKVLGR